MLGVVPVGTQERAGRSGSGDDRADRARFQPGVVGAAQLLAQREGGRLQVVGQRGADPGDVAGSQGYKPKYSTSDWFLNTTDSTQQNFNPTEFDGSIGIASLGTMLVRSGKPAYPGWDTCSKIATR